MATQQRGPFDRILKTTTDGPEPPGPDRAAVYVAGTIVGLAILLLVLVLPPVSILSRGGGDSGIPSGPGNADTYTSTVRTGTPKLPAGLVAASALFDLAAPQDQRGAAKITVPLKEKQTEQRSLALYTYLGGKWQRISDATLVASGEAARGDVESLPGNVIVLRRSKATLQVAGSIPAGATLDKRAEPVITTLHPIVFIPTGDGSIIGQPPAVPPAGYKVVPGIVAPKAEIVDNILRSSDLQAKHAAAIAEQVKQGNFAGIDVDYRGVNPSLRTQFTSFAGLLAKALHADGRTLTLMLPMPVNENGTMQSGAYDWEQLGKSADTLELAGELDQELYFQNTEAALNFITDRVDRSKVLLSISALSVERGGDGLRTLSLDDALARASIVMVKSTGDIRPSSKVQLVAQNLAASGNASGMRWDESARSVTFKYPGRGGTRTVWIANAFSTAFRLDLAQRHGLGGVTVNDVSTQGGGADIWTPIRQVSDTGNLTLSRPNGELLTPAWSTGDGTLAPQTGDAVTWTAPVAEGTYTVTLIVSDGVVRSGQLVSLDVAPAAAAPAP
jgi:hypothetical protein